MIVLEPWEQRLCCTARLMTGPLDETIRVWGRDRLQVLARLLPLLDEAEVYLLGTGLPSFWSVGMGEMRLLLGTFRLDRQRLDRCAARLEELAPPADRATACWATSRPRFKGGRL